jgi:membrane protein implicated in regulation of membrane protease activity
MNIGKLLIGVCLVPTMTACWIIFSIGCVFKSGLIMYIGGVGAAIILLVLMSAGMIYLTWKAHQEKNECYLG